MTDPSRFRKKTCDAMQEHKSVAFHTTSLGLISRLRAGEEAGWQRMVVLYAPLIYSWARRAGINREDAMDVVQEVLHAAYRRAESFRRDRPGDTFRGWLRTICKTKIADHWRKRGAGPMAVGGSAAHRQLEQVEFDLGTGDEETGFVVTRAMNAIEHEFEPQTWQAFLRTAVGGEDPESVARELGKSRNAVYLAKYKVLRRLREEIGDE